MVNHLFKAEPYFFSNKRDCMMINEDQAILVPSLSCNHEEADTKLVALVCAANVRQRDSVMVRSPSADIDILTLFVSQNFGDITIYIDNGTGKNRKIINVSRLQNCRQERRARLSGFTHFPDMTMYQLSFAKGNVHSGKQCWSKANSWKHSVTWGRS